MALQSFPTLRRVGSEALLGPLVALSLIRELGPVLTALMVTGRAGSAIAAEIGIMRTTEQIDALELMGLNPLRYVVVPNLLAALVALPVLTAVFDVVGTWGGYLVGVRLLGLDGGTYFGEISNYAEMKDILGGIYKALTFGLHHRLGVLLQGIPQPVRGRRRERRHDAGGGQCFGADPGLGLLRDFGCVLGRRAMIRVEGVWKSFGSQEVLRGVSFEIQPGEFTALIGLSGCGKSLLLKHLVGLAQTGPRPDLGRRPGHRTGSAGDSSNS